VVSQNRQAAAAGRGRGAFAIEELIGGAVLVEQRIAASPATVFSYLTQPDKFVQWMGARAWLDAKGGGAFRIDVDGEHIASGQYREVDPPRRLVMTWGWEGSGDVPPGSSTVEITLEPVGEQQTLLRLRHTGLPSEEQRDSHRQGWTMYVGKLASIF
jgi:uncharacterized protein YndB with AHSA1/START domain